MKSYFQKFGKAIFIVCCSILTLAATAQIQLQLKGDSLPAEAIETFKFREKYPDSLAALSTSQGLVEHLVSQNYLLAALDSFWLENGVAFAEIYLGNTIEIENLEFRNIPQSYLSSVGFRRNNYKNKAFNWLKINELKIELLKQFENNGFPFAQLSLEEINLNNGKLNGVLSAEVGPKIFFNKLENFGKVEVSPQYLQRYLGIIENQPYDRSKFLKIKNRIRELPFLKEGKSALIDFKFDRANVKLDLKLQKASRFDFVIGVLPNNQELGRLVVTGHFTGEFQNEFGQGERIFAEIKQLRPLSPQLDLEYEHPFFLNLPFGVDADFHLHRRDTTFLDVDFDIGIKYLLEAGNFFNIFFTQNNSRLLSVDEDNLLIIKSLPEQLDFTKSSLGAGWRYQNLDYRFNPMAGWESQFSTTFGLRTIKENSSILELSDANFDFESLYDSIQNRTFQAVLNFSIAKYTPTFNNQTLKLGFTGKYIFSNESIYKNEQKRIGGNQLLRGFDEEAIFATNYVVATAEYRLLTGDNSFLFTFLDAGFVENKTIQMDANDFPIGFGAGVTFDTSAGIFGLSYALGRQQGNPLNFNSGKIHFGYLSLF